MKSSLKMEKLAFDGKDSVLILNLPFHDKSHPDLTLCDPMDRLLRPRDFLGKSTGVGCHFLLQGFFPTQGSNPGLPHCRQMLYRLSHQGSPDYSVSSPKSGLCLGTAIYDPGWDFGVSKGLIGYIFKGIKCHI